MSKPTLQAIIEETIIHRQVRLSASFKQKMTTVRYADNTPESKKAAEMVLKGNKAHIAEFGNSVGFVRGFVDYGSQLGPEVDVEWFNTGLKYGYHPSELEVVAGKDLWTHDKSDNIGWKLVPMLPVDEKMDALASKELGKRSAKRKSRKLK